MATIFYPKYMLIRAEKLQVKIDNFKSKEIQILQGYIETIDKAMERWRLKLEDSKTKVWEKDTIYMRAKTQISCENRLEMYEAEKQKFMGYIEKIKQISVKIPDLTKERITKRDLQRFKKHYGLK